MRNDKQRVDADETVELKLRTYGSVPATAPQWTWYPWIPTNYLSYCYGLPGTGKSGIIIAVSALITQGLPLPTAFNEDDEVPEITPVCGNALYLSAEDGTGDNIRPRLEANGADCSKVLFLEGVTENECAVFDILKYCSQLEDAVRKTNAKVVCIDPLQSFASDIDMNRATDMRRLTNALIGIARRNNCGIVVVSHRLYAFSHK